MRKGAGKMQSTSVRFAQKLGKINQIVGSRILISSEFRKKLLGWLKQFMCLGMKSGFSGISGVRL